MASAHCPSCQAGRLITGTIRSSGRVHFSPDAVKFLSFHTSDLTLRAKMCSACGLISMIGDVEKLRILESRNEAEKGLQSEPR